MTRQVNHHDPVRVAVTGVGGGCGQGICKALMSSTIPTRIFPVDVTPFSAGLYLVKEKGQVLPRPEDDIDAWHDWLVEKKIELVIPGSDHDIEPLAAVKDQWKKDGISVAVQPLDFCQISNDKLKTARMLMANMIDSPDTCLDLAELDEFVERMGFPLVIKPGFGMSSRGVEVVQDREELDFFLKRTKNPVIQEFLAGDEYTCALFFGFRNGLNARFVMQRDLYAGSTYRAYVVDPVLFEPFFTDFTLKMYRYKLFGPVNLQLKWVPDRGPVVFEINARASGSTAMRAHFGYNEAHMMLREFVLNEQAFQPNIQYKGVALRIWEEVFLEGITKDDLDHGAKPKGRIDAMLG